MEPLATRVAMDWFMLTIPEVEPVRMVPSETWGEEVLVLFSAQRISKPWW